MTSDQRFGRIAVIGAIAAAAIVGAVLFALYPNNYSSGGTTQTAQYSGDQTYNGNSNNTGTPAQNAYNATNAASNNSSGMTQQSGAGSANTGPGY